MTPFEVFVIFMLLGISGRIYLTGNAIRSDLRAMLNEQKRGKFP